MGESQNYDGHSITGDSYNGEFMTVDQSKDYDGRSITLSEWKNYDRRSITVGEAQNYDGRSITGDSYDGHSITMSEYERSTKPEGEGKVWLSRRKSQTVEDNISNNSYRNSRSNSVDGEGKVWLSRRVEGKNNSNNSSLRNSCSSLQLQSSNTSGLIMTRRRRSTIRTSSIDLSDKSEEKKEVKGTCCVLL